MVITVEKTLFRVFSAYSAGNTLKRLSAENTLKSLSSTVMTGCYFKPCIFFDFFVLLVLLLCFIYLFIYFIIIYFYFFFFFFLHYSCMQSKGA